MFGQQARQDVLSAIKNGKSARELLESDFQALVGRMVLVLRIHNGNLSFLEVEAIGKIVHIGIGGHYDFGRTGNFAWVSVGIDYPMKIRGVVRNASKCFDVYAEANDFATLLAKLRDKFPTMFPINRGFVLCSPENNLEELTTMIFSDKR